MGCVGDGSRREVAHIYEEFIELPTRAAVSTSHGEGDEGMGVGAIEVSMVGKGAQLALG